MKKYTNKRDKPKVYIRADGNTEIGLGHIIRSLALANMLKEDFDCIFATRFLTPYIKKEAEVSCVEVTKLPEEGDKHFSSFLSLLSGREIVVLDNYFYPTEYQQLIKDKGCKLVCIDDIHDKHFVADVIINHAGGLNRELYSSAPYSALYTGTEYALLRPSFLSRKKTQGDSIFISMGGADKNNDTLNILELLNRKNINKTCFVIIGDAYLHKTLLYEFCDKTTLNIKILKNLTAEEMSEIMLQCHYAICPPSTISYEYLSLIGGELYVNVIADNQKDLYKFFIKENLAFDTSSLFVKDKIQVSNSIEQQKKYFDGQSDKRLLNIFHKLEQDKHLQLSDAKREDLDLYFKWVNDPDGRSNALSSDLIKYEDHCTWFTKKIASHNTYLWILKYKDIPVGQIRFELENDCFIISYFIDSKYRGKGTGLSIVKLGIERLLKIRKGIALKALVKKTNIASCKIFEQLNFKKSSANDNFFEYIK